MIIEFNKEKATKIILEIMEDIKEQEEYLSEIKRYVKEFPMELDYNYAEYGNLLIYYSDIREFMTKYDKIYDKYEDTDLWNIYKFYVGIAINKLILIGENENETSKRYNK